VKNWTLRQRILASFAVIIAIMLLMVVVSYSRLLKIEAGEESVRDDAVPGVYLSSMIRSAWVDSYLDTLDIIGLRKDKTLTEADKADYKSFEARIITQMANYKATINGAEDQAEFDKFEALHQANALLKEVEEALITAHQPSSPAANSSACTSAVSRSATPIHCIKPRSSSRTGPR